MKQGIFYTILFIFIVSFFFVLALSAVNELTKDRVEKNRLLNERKSVLSAFHVGFASDDEAFEEFDKLIKTEDRDGSNLYVYASPEGTFYAIRFQGNGLWGIIKIILAVDSSLTRIVGVHVVEHIETPGLGGRIDEAAYRDQFKNEKVGDDGKIRLARTGVFDTDHENGSVDTISGATRTSESMRNITNAGLAWLRDHAGGNE